MAFIFEHFLGTLVNFIFVLIAGILGTLIKRGVPKRFTDIIMSAMAICVIYIGIDGIIAPAPAVNDGSFLNAGLMKVLVMILSMAVGTAIGELIDLDKQMNRLGLWLGNIFKNMTSKKGKVEASDGADADDGTKFAECFETSDSDNVDVGKRFAEGFVGCSLLFCVGAMSVNGAILDAQGEPAMLLAKTVIDAISCFIMSTTLGIGCAFSAFPVLIYQGIFNVVGLVLATLLSEATIAYMSVTGSLIIILIGTNLMGMTKIKTANMVPSIFVAIGIEALLKLIFGA